MQCLSQAYWGGRSSDVCPLLSGNPKRFGALIRNLALDQRDGSRQPGLLWEGGMEWLCSGTSDSRARTGLSRQDLRIQTSA